MLLIFFESELDYDDEMILFGEEEKLNKLWAACYFLHGELARIAELRSAKKEFAEFDPRKIPQAPAWEPQ